MRLLPQANRAHEDRAANPTTGAAGVTHFDASSMAMFVAGTSGSRIR
jgi:hypothetical protein